MIFINLFKKNSITDIEKRIFSKYFSEIQLKKYFHLILIKNNDIIIVSVSKRYIPYFYIFFFVTCIIIHIFKKLKQCILSVISCIILKIICYNFASYFIFAIYFYLFLHFMASLYLSVYTYMHGTMYIHIYVWNVL